MISDRRDEFFDQFIERDNELLAEQEAGIGAYYVLVADYGSVLGRFDLFFAEPGTAKLGYRVSSSSGGIFAVPDSTRTGTARSSPVPRW